MDRALELLNEGKRDLLVSAIPDAVTNFSKCCEMLVSLKGEMGAECAEAYFYYGKALLEMSRLEAEVLGHAMEGIDIYAEDSSDPQVSWLMSLIFIVNTLYRLRVLMLCPIPRRLLSKRMSRRL